VCPKIGQASFRIISAAADMRRPNPNRSVSPIQMKTGLTGQHDQHIISSPDSSGPRYPGTRVAGRQFEPLLGHITSLNHGPRIMTVMLKYSF